MIHYRLVIDSMRNSLSYSLKYTHTHTHIYIYIYIYLNDPNTLHASEFSTLFIIRSVALGPIHVHRSSVHVRTRSPMRGDEEEIE